MFRNSSRVPSRHRRYAQTGIASLATVALLSGITISGASLAHADDNVATPLPVSEPNVLTQTSPEAQTEAALTTTASKTLADYQRDGADAIAKRQTTLATLAADITKQTKDCGSNGAMQAEIARTSASLNTIAVALAATPDLNAAKVFFRQIFVDHRVYLVVAPKAGKIVRCATILVRNDALAAEAAKLQVLLDAAKARGIDTTVAQTAKNAALTQLASINPIPAIAGVLNLVPDRGDNAIQAANATAFKSSDTQLDAIVEVQKSVNRQLDITRKALRGDVNEDRVNDRNKAKADREAARAEKETAKAKERADKEARKAAERADKQARKAAERADKQSRRGDKKNGDD